MQLIKIKKEHSKQANPYRIELNRIELNWIELNWIESNWIELNWIELNWIELNWIELRNTWTGPSSTKNCKESCQTHHTGSTKFQSLPQPENDSFSLNCAQEGIESKI
jgi:hypothetical protein